MARSKYKNTAKPKYKIIDDKSNVLIIVAAVIAIVRLILMLVLESGSFYHVYIATNIIMAALLILYAVLNKEKTSVIARIALIIYGISWITPILADSFRTNYIISIAVMWIVSILLCVSCIGKDEEEGKALKILTASLVLLDFMYILGGDKYEYAESPGAIHFWFPSLIVGLIFTLIAAVLMIKDLIYLKDDRISEKIAVVFLAFVASFALMWITMTRLNYALDTNDPVISEYVIVDKKQTSGKDASNYLHVEINGREYRIDVSSKVYREYEIGDSIKLSYYEGAFNDPFYTYE